MKKYLKLWILPLVLVVVSLGARTLARSAWDSLVDFRAPQFSLEPGERAEPLSRVVIVVADGLRIDAFHRIDYLSRHKQNGAYFILKTGQPSLSLPSFAVIATGAWQDVTGVTTNWFEGPVRQDSLFSLASDAGIASAIVGEEGWGKLFGEAAAKSFTRKWEDDYITFDERTLEKAIEFLSESPGLLLVHFVETDEAGHDFGGASPEYQKYADHIGTLIERLHRNLPEDAVLMVTADHGQIDRGGHGGWEEVVTHVPLLMFGKRINPGDYGKAKQTDIAPTAAALAGLPIPPYSQGRILAEALDLGDRKAQLQELISRQKEAFTKAYLKAIGANTEQILAEVKPLPTEGGDAYWDRVFESGRKAKIAARRARNIPLVLAVALLPLLAFWIAGRKYALSFARPAVLSLLYFAVFYGLFFASGKTVSLSAINDEDLLQRFFNEVMLSAAVAAVAAVIGLAFLDRRKERYEAAKSSVILIAVIAFLVLLQIDLFFLHNGPLLTWHIPDMRLGFKYYLDLMALVILGLASVVFPLISIGAHRLWSRLEF